MIRFYSILATNAITFYPLAWILQKRKMEI